MGTWLTMMVVTIVTGKNSTQYLLHAWTHLKRNEALVYRVPTILLPILYVRKQLQMWNNFLNLRKYNRVDSFRTQGMHVYCSFHVIRFYSSGWKTGSFLYLNSDGRNNGIIFFDNWKMPLKSIYLFFLIIAVCVNSSKKNN